MTVEKMRLSTVFSDSWKSFCSSQNMFFVCFLFSSATACFLSLTARCSSLTARCSSLTVRCLTVGHVQGARPFYSFLKADLITLAFSNAIYLCFYFSCFSVTLFNGLVSRTPSRFFTQNLGVHNVWFTVESRSGGHHIAGF